jgi:hypothetical protein
VLSRLLGVEVPEYDATGRLAAVHPGMVCRLLDENVAGLEMYGLVVEHHVDLAVYHDRIVDSARAVHEAAIMKGLGVRACIAAPPSVAGDFELAGNRPGTRRDDQLPFMQND